MENGTESPVYQFQLNLAAETPEVEVDFEYGYTLITPELQSDGTVGNSLETEYIDVFFTDIYSSYSDLQVYYVSYAYQEDGSAPTTQDAYNVYQLTQNDLANGFRITTGCHYDSYYSREAMYGYNNSRTEFSGGHYYNRGADCFFIITDASGNAVAVYPIDEYSDGHQIGDLSISGNVYDNEDGTGSIDLPADEAEMGRFAENITITIDGELAAVLDYTYAYEIATYEDSTEQYLKSTGTRSEALGFGAAGFTVNEYDYEYLQIVWPYDSSIAEGAEVDHTVVITYTLDGKTKSESFEISAANTKPALTGHTTGIGSVKLSYNVPVNTANSGISTTDYIQLTDTSLYGKSYTVEFTDLYGNAYSQEITIGEMSGLTISYSTLEPTTEPVTVTVTYTADMYLDGDTTGSKELVLTFTENGSKKIYDAEGNLLGEIYVSNIYASLDVDPYILWSYRANDVQDGNIIYGNVTAYLMDHNGAAILDPATGEPAKFVFYPGGETSHTFTGCYSELGTAVADTTAELEVTLKMEPVSDDSAAPDVDILSYVTFDSKAYDAEAVYRVNSGRFQENTWKDYTALYGNDCYFADMTEMVASLGWADSYMFHFDIRDESKVKIILRADLYETNISYTTKSQDIDGVSLVGRTLEIKENTEFALYLVDEYDNVTPIRFYVTTLGSIPVPSTSQVPAVGADGKYAVRVYLLPLQLSGVEDLKITTDGAEIDENDYSSTVEGLEGASELYSQYTGLYYMTYTKNGTYSIAYSFTYRGTSHNGTIAVTVNSLNNEKPSVVKGTFSGNYYEAPTNQDVSWQADLNMAVRSISAVYMKDGKYAAISSLEMEEYGVFITYMEDSLTVIFEGNTTALEEKYGTVYLKLTGHNNVVGYYALPSVTAVDKAGPVLNALVTYADDHKSATVTITTDEPAISQTSYAKGESFTFTIREAGKKTFRFVDEAGNISAIDVEVDQLVLEDLTITLMDKDGNIIENPARYEAEIGETLQVLTNRPATVWVFGDVLDAKECDGTTPVELVVSENNMGLHPTFGAEDTYGNTAAVQLEYIMPRNLVAPVITVNRITVMVPENATDDEIRAKLLDNILYSDDMTAYAELKLTIEIESITENKSVVTYTVTDDAGNASTAQCWLKIRSGLVPEILVNGREVQADDILYLGITDDIQITVNYSGNVAEPYKLVYEAGNLLSWAKLKDGTYLTEGYIDEVSHTFTLTELDEGWYSFALTTQSMEIYYFQIHLGEVG